MPKDAEPFADTDSIDAVITFYKKPTQSTNTKLKELAVKLSDSEVNSHIGCHKHARISWNTIEKVAELPDVKSIDSSWQPSVCSTLDLSASSVGADDLWSLPNEAKYLTQGGGTVIADFDTGVDVFHPGLWRADGGDFEWIDVNGNGVFDSGIDAVDINRSGTADAVESLRFFKAAIKDYRGIVTNNTGSFNSKLDWLYNDANGNGIRDYGSSYGESTPTYGERIFILRDSNSNGTVDIGEKLAALGTCKIAAMLGTPTTEFTRGVDLINVPTDTVGHGTSVCGILAEEEPWLRKYVGISPNSDLLVADRSKTDYTTYIPWAEQHGAKVMLYQFGAWTYQFLDGSSPLEQAISAEWDKGIPQIIPAGNLANGNKHAIIENTGGPSTFPFSIPSGRGITTVYLSAIWLPPDSGLSFTLINPSGVRISMPGNGNFYKDSSGNQCWSYGVQESPKGTHRFDFYISVLSFGTWNLEVSRTNTEPITFHTYISDNLGGWTGGAYLTSYVSQANTVSWPATADKALVVGSYSTRGIGVNSGDISLSSARGPRIDGNRAIDVCAPGNSDVFAICSKNAGNAFGSYREFSGTSAAAPHVAAACAVLLQRNPLLSSDQVADLITATAKTDSFTGTVPNSAWGYGKLDILSASVGTPGLGSTTAASARDLPDESPVTLFAKNVTAVAADNSWFYLEENNRSSGIRVMGSGVLERDKVMVSGTLTTMSGERVVIASTTQVLQSNLVALIPLGMNNSAIGGASVGKQVTNNVGLLITTWGIVTNSASNRFTIDDGSGSPVLVLCQGLTPPVVGSYVTVTGISSTTNGNGGYTSIIIPRRQLDIVIVKA